MELDSNINVRRNLAQHSSTSQEVLRILAQDQDKYTRMWVASNPSTEVDVLIALSKAKNIDVRSAVAENPKLPIEIIEDLSCWPQMTAEEWRSVMPNGATGWIKVAHG